MGVKIKLGEDGRVPEEVMTILRNFSAHRDLCDQCGKAFSQAMRPDAYCATGYELLLDLGKQEGVSEFDD